MAATGNLDTQRIKFIRDELRRRLAKAKRTSATFTFQEVAQMPLFGSRLAFQRVLELIQEHTGKKVRFDTAYSTQQILPGGYKHPGNSVTDSSGYILQPTVVPSQPIGYEVYAVNPKELDTYFDVVLERTKSKFDSKQIRSIEVIESAEDPKVTIMINENPEHCITFKPKDYWEKLIDIARNGSAHSNDAQRVADYFNTNNQCPLYTKTKKKDFGYTLSRLLVVSGDMLSPAPGVKIKMKTHKTVAQRKKRFT